MYAKPEKTEPTPRQLQILELMAHDKGLKEIARELKISHQTVKNLLYQLHQRLGTTSSIAALYRAFKRGWIR